VSAAVALVIVCAFLIYSPALHSHSANAGKSADVPPLQAATPSGDSEATFTVVVHPGDTLQTIALQSLGQSTGQILEQIQKLNPAVTNLDHIEPGQEIRLPNLFYTFKTPSDGRSNEKTAKN
jgi:nucleoid-associated protein YgaU